MVFFVIGVYVFIIFMKSYGWNFWFVVFVVVVVVGFFGFVFVVFVVCFCGYYFVIVSFGFVVIIY